MYSSLFCLSITQELEKQQQIWGWPGATGMKIKMSWVHDDCSQISKEGITAQHWQYSLTSANEVKAPTQLKQLFQYGGRKEEPSQQGKKKKLLNFGNAAAPAPQKYRGC